MVRNTHYIVELLRTIKSPTNKDHLWGVFADSVHELNLLSSHEWIDDAERAAARYRLNDERRKRGE